MYKELRLRVSFLELKNRLILMLVLFFFLIGYSPAIFSLDQQKNISQYLIDSYSTADGLPQNSILSIVQTDDGYLWMGTYEGLVRYNGLDFETFNKKNVSNIKNNSISSLCKDSKNRLWIGTPDGLICYRNEKFVRYSVEDGLVGNFILKIYEDSNKKIWIGTTDGLSLKIGKNFKNYTKENGLAHNYILRIVDDINGNLLVSTGKIGFDLIKKDRVLHYSTKNGLTSNFIRALYRLKDGRILIGMRGGGISVFENEKISKFKPEHELSTKDVMAIYQDVHKTIWIGTEKSGLYCYKNDLFSNRSLNQKGKNSLIRTFLEDREGSLWIGSKSGLFRIMDGKYSEFNSKNILPFNTVRTVFEDKKGTLWLGSEEKGLFTFNINSLSSKYKKINIHNHNVRSITEDKDGVIWYGTLGNGVFKIIENNIEQYSTSNGLSNNFVRVVFADSRNGIWVGTNGGGVNLIKNGNIIKYSTKNGLSDDFIYSINEDIYGRIWIGTYSGGLNRIDGNKITVYGQNSGLKDNIYWAIYPDKNGSVWFGTNGGGLFWFKDGKFFNFNTEHGLYSDLAFQIIEASILDKDSGKKLDYLWMNCNNGVFIINKKEIEAYVPGKSKNLKCKVFGILSRNIGIIGGGPAQPAGWKGKDGKIYFSGKNGLSVFNPENIYINKVPPGVIISKLEVDRIKVDGIDYNNKKAVKIPPGKKRFEFFYTGLSYINAKEINYKYKIEGIDKNWVNAGTERRALYMNIPPGHYSFKLMAFNSDGIRSENSVSILFEFQAFFWQTILFKISMIFLLLFIIILYIRSRIKRIKKVMRKENRQKLNLQRIEIEKYNLEKEISQKRDFSAMIIHDLKSPLTALIGYAEMIKTSEKSGIEKTEFKRIGDVMSRSLDNILKLVNSMLDLSKFEAGKMDLNYKETSLVKITEDVLEVVEPLINKKQIRLERRYNYNDMLHCDPDKIGQIIHNLINNGIKFSPENSSVYIKINDSVEQNGFVEFAVIDEGIGVEENKRKDLFKIYSQLGSNEDNEKGTGLGLNISRIIVEAHKGKIGYRKSPTGKGSVFFFTLPKN